MKPLSCEYAMFGTLLANGFQLFEDGGSSLDSVQCVSTKEVNGQAKPLPCAAADSGGHRRTTRVAPHHSQGTGLLQAEAAASYRSEGGSRADEAPDWPTGLGSSSINA